MENVNQSDDGAAGDTGQNNYIYNQQQLVTPQLSELGTAEQNRREHRRNAAGTISQFEQNLHIVQMEHQFLLLEERERFVKFLEERVNDMIRSSRDVSDEFRQTAKEKDKWMSEAIFWQRKYAILAGMEDILKDADLGTDSPPIPDCLAEYRLPDGTILSTDPYVNEFLNTELIPGVYKSKRSNETPIRTESQGPVQESGRTVTNDKQDISPNEAPQRRTGDSAIAGRCTSNAPVRNEYSRSEDTIRRRERRGLAHEIGRLLSNYTQTTTNPSPDETS